MNTFSTFLPKHSLLIFLFFCMLLPVSYSQNTQIWVNKSWEALRGNPSSGLEWSASVSDGFGNIYTTGNTVDNNQNINLLLYKQNPNGQLLWEVTYNGGSGTKNYGIALALDANNNIYVAGARFDPIALSHDYLILKYTSQANLLWSQTYGGSGGSDDLPSAIGLDQNGNAFLTGVTKKVATLYDYLTVKISNTGTFQWAKEYDYNSLPDAAVAIKVLPSGSDIRVIVTGGSAATLTDWDYANLYYNGSDGALVNEIRTGATGTGLEIPTALTTDGSGNYYVTGYGGNGGQQNNAYTVKLDEDFNILWESWYDGDGLDNKAFDVEVDNNGIPTFADILKKPTEATITF
jgi:hypothetical protein